MAEPKPDDVLAPDRWRLVIDSAGPGFRDREIVQAPTRPELDPKIIEVEGVKFERYGDDDDYVEIRQEFIIVRSLNPLPPPTPPSDEVTTDNEGRMRHARTRDS